MAGGGSCAPIAGGGSCALMAGGGSCAQIAGGGSCAPIAGGVVFSFRVRALDRVVKTNLLFDVLDLRFHKTRNADLRFQGHLLCDDLAIVAVSFVRYVICFCLKITASVRRIIVQNIKRHFAGMQPAFAKLCFFFGCHLAKHILLAVAHHVFVCAFVYLHFILLTPSPSPQEGT